MKKQELRKVRENFNFFLEHQKKKKNPSHLLLKRWLQLSLPRNSSILAWLRHVCLCYARL